MYQTIPTQVSRQQELKYASFLLIVFLEITMIHEPELVSFGVDASAHTMAIDSRFEPDAASSLLSHSNKDQIRSSCEWKEWQFRQRKKLVMNDALLELKQNFIMKIQMG